MKKRLLSALLTFCMVLTLLPVSALAVDSPADSSVSTSKDGITINKTVSGDKDNGYELTLEAYANNTVTATTVFTPLDIVLVLDQSGSMTDEFEGSSNRQAAMKSAVISFIDSVANRYSDTADHRMAIVTFGSDANTLQGWTSVDASGETILKNKVSSLSNPYNQATNVAEGMGEAETLMGSGYTYIGSNNQNRQKVVIVFTDGVPTTSSTYSNDVADSAVATSKRLKDDGVTIYTIGIFNGADPSEMYGTTDDTTGTPGEVGYTWSAERIIAWGDVADVEVGGANRFLNLLSSNYPSANNDGLNYESKNYIVYEWASFKITQNFDRISADRNYYFTASNSSGLEDVFQAIYDELNSLQVYPNESAVLTDTLSEYFNFPEGLSGTIDLAANEDVEVKYVPVDPITGEFDESRAEKRTDVTVNISDGTITVTGFNYFKNAVTEKDGAYSGGKLVVTFPIELNEAKVPATGGALPTNATTEGNKAGLYYKKTAESESNDSSTLLDSSPTVDVSAKTYTVTYTDGVDGETVFEDQTTGNLLVGSATPEFEGSLEREDYVFVGWDPEVSETVTETVTYVAQWKDDKNNNGTPDDEETTYTVTYTDGVDGEEVFADQVTSGLLSGTVTPAFEGTPSREGYTFAGWDPAVAATVTDDAVYTATWIENAPEYQTVNIVIYRNGNTTTPYATIPVVGDHEIGDTISISGLNISDYYTEGGTPGEDYVFEGWYNDGGWNDYLAGDPNNTLGETITVSGWTNIICMVTDYERVVVYGVTDGVKTDDDVLYSGKALHGENVIDYLEENVENLNRDGYTHDEWFKWDAYGTEIKFGDTDVVSGWTNVYVAYTTQIPDEPTYDDLKDLGFKILVTDKNSPIPHGNLTYNLLEHTYTLSQESATSYRIILNVADYAARYDVDKGMPEGTHVSTTTQGKAYFDITWEAGQWTCDDLTETIGVKCTAPDAPSAEELSDLIKITVKDFADGTVTEGATDHGNQIFAPAEGTYTVTDVTPNQDTKTYTATLTLTDGAAYAGLFDDILVLENGTHTLTTTISKLDPITLTYDPATGNWTANQDGWSLGVKCDPEDITPDQYTIVYHGNGGYVTSNPDKDQTTSTANVGEKITLKNADTFTRDGYVFQGWALTAEGEVAYQGSQKVTFDAQAGDKVNLYAVWAEEPAEEQVITVRFDNQDGTWADGEDGYESQYTMFSTTPDATNTAPTVAAPEGKVFAYWIDQMGNRAMEDGEAFSYSSIAEEFGLTAGDVLLRAVYEDASAEPEETYNVYFVIPNEQGGSFDPHNEGDTARYTTTAEVKELTDGVTYTVNFPKVEVNSGYELTGWRIVGTETVTWDPEAWMLEGVENYAVGNDLTIEAIIEKVGGEEPSNSYTVAFYAGSHGSLSGTTRFEIDAGSSMVESGYSVPNVNANNYYSFNGWLGSDGSTFSSNQVRNLTINSNITFTAQYKYTGGGGGSETETYAVYYHSNYGSDERKTGGRYEENDEVEVRDNDWWDRDNYRFLGWNTEEDGSGRDYDPEDTFDMPDEDVHLYARWRRTASDPSDSGTDRWLETQDHRLYMVGYPDDTFGPDRNMTRAEVAQMFYALLLDQNVSYTENFSDVPSDAWYAEAVNTLAALGMIDGYPDGTFRPDATITRAEFCVIALAFAYEPESFDCSFYDVSVNDWFYDYVAQATSYGWISGGSGAFRPNDAITRAEVSVIVNNMLGRVADEDYVDRHEDELTTFPDVTSSYWAYYSIMETTNSHDYTKSNGTENWR